MYPGEIDEAREQGHSLAHLEILDANYHGGLRVKCRAKDTATCDNGYKPLDCVSYPFFPGLSLESGNGNGGPAITLSKGSGCPILGHEIPKHQRFVREIWKKLMQRRPEVTDWLRWFDLSSVDDFDPEPYDPF